MKIYIAVQTSLGGYTSCEKAFKSEDEAKGYIKDKNNEIQSYDIEEVELT